MSVTLDSTLAGINANSYISVAYADDYWDSHYSATKAAAWKALKPAQKPQLLIQATRVIETARFTTYLPVSEYSLRYDHYSKNYISYPISLEPAKFYFYQRLQFPRNLDYDTTIAAFYMPDAVGMAQCEQAAYLLSFDETAISNRIQGIVNDTIEIGKNQIHLNQEYTETGSMFSPMALEFIRPLLVKSTVMRRA